MMESGHSELFKQLPKSQRILEDRGSLTSLYFFEWHKRMPGTL